MKKSLLFSFMVAGLVMMSSCTKEKVIVVGGDDSNAAQQIVLQVANTGDGLQTRAGRPLYSSEAKQTIENVKVIICKDDVVKYVKTVENWNTTSSTEYTTGGHGRETTIEIPKSPIDERLKEDGKYTVYAFGYHSGTEYENLNKDIAAIAAGSAFNPNTILNIKAGVKGEEIFAGSITFELKKEIGFKRPVVLNRQVAGTFGYFEAIPYFDGATKLQLVAPQRNTKLVLGEFANFDLSSNGGNDGHINFVVNGTEKASDNNVIYEIELSKWFNDLKDDNKDGLIDYDAANWKNPYKTGATFKTGSVFGGTFLIPFAKVGAENTFVLKLTNDDASHEYATWTVKLPTDDKQTAEYTLKSWGADSFVAATCTDNTTAYNVVRNHLYGIGERTLDNPGTSNPDKPEPLNKKQELTLRVNDNWEAIHKMEIEQD